MGILRQPFDLHWIDFSIYRNKSFLVIAAKLGGTETFKGDSGTKWKRSQRSEKGGPTSLPGAGAAT